MLKKITENPVLKLINNIVYVILFLIVASVLFVVILQRASNNDIALGGIRIFNIVSESMVPKYNIGDVLVVKSIEPQNIKVGDDIAYIGQESTFNQKIVTHQVIKIDYENGEYIFHTKGIANIFSQMGLVEAWGSGIKRILNAAEEYGLPKPKFQEFDNMFRVELFRNSFPMTNEKENIGEASEKYRE